MGWKKTILIGGIQGEGVASTGINLMKALSGIGYYSYGERKFSSRIKGGNTHLLMTISNEPVQCVTSTIDIILSFDEETVRRNKPRLAEQGLILVDETAAMEDESLSSNPSFTLPFTSIAKENGSELMKNTCAIGFLGKLLQVEQGVLEESIEKTYRKKEKEIIGQNRQVLQAAYEAQLPTIEHFHGLPPADSTDLDLMMMMGNDAITVGALMAGCRFVAAYPITPASDIMEMMSRELPETGGIMIQTEDEIAAVTMCIGASYAGVRSLTATSGPGLTLMMEGLGLAGMTETPLVVIDTQRSGPSTGMPTRTEQSDLSTLYHAGHGEFPLILLTPSTVQECYELTMEAFNLAETHQCPVVLMTDLNLSLSPQTIPALRYRQVNIDRGLTADPELLKKNPDQPFSRYVLTESGISPRSFPGMTGGVHQATGLEHNELGRPSDLPENRKLMMDKRKRKMDTLKDKNAVHVIEKDGKGLCLTFGSPWGVLKEAVEQKDLPVDIARISRIRPLPQRQMKQLLSSYEKIIVLEQNQQGQLAGILRQELNEAGRIESYTRYDGESFKVKEVQEMLERWCAEWK